MSVSNLIVTKSGGLQNHHNTFWEHKSQIDQIGGTTDHTVPIHSTVTPTELVRIAMPQFWILTLCVSIWF